MNDLIRKEPYPIHIDIDLASSCNLRCRFCHLTFYHPKEDKIMTYDEFMSLHSILPNLKSITLFSKFEPLLCKDFLKIFNKICEYNIESYFSTNGLLLDDDIFRGIVGRLKFLTVSITGFTRKTYKKNMGIDGFERIIKALHKLNNLKSIINTEYPFLRISTTGMLDTINELKLAIDFARDVNAREGVQVTSFKAHTDHLANLMPNRNPIYFTEITNTAIEYAKKLNVKFDLQSGTIADNKRTTQEIGHKICYMPWYRISIQPNGDVYPCPVAYEPIGNIFNTDIIDIWNGTAMAEFRKGVNKKESMNIVCENCTHCRHRAINNEKANNFSKSQSYVFGMTRN
jgi:radical SAM protein with 4Fe4S-binding SPASM domain